MASRDWFICWIDDPAAAFDPAVHRRADVVWTDISLQESEGADATLVTVETARMASAELVGKRWAFLSFEHPNGTLYPVARMKRRKLPPGSREGVVTLEFEAGLLPGWKDLRDAGLAELRDTGAFDPILVSPTRQSDPTEILDGHRRIGHFDRVTGDYSTPELLGQGLPKKTFGPGDYVGWEQAGISVSGNRGAIRGVQLTISAAWLQILEGLFDASGAIANLFPELALGSKQSSYLFKGEFDPSTKIGKGAVATLTPDELLSGWPKPGASLGGQSGYTVADSGLIRVGPDVFAGATQPKTAGPVSGSRSRYVDYTTQTNPGDAEKATQLALDITYYTARLILSFSARQQREQIVSVFVPNGACDDPDAPVRTLNLRCEDPTVDATTVPWLPVTHYAVGDVRRFGWYSWICLKDHVSTTSFTADAAAGDWRVAPQDQSYIGGPGGYTYFTLPRGIQTIRAGISKAIKIIALAQRGNAFEWTVPFEDVVEMSTAWCARIEAPDEDLPGGFAEGKVVSFNVKDSAGASGWPRATIRIAACDGTGEDAPAGGDIRVGYLDAGWDVVSLTAIDGYPAPADIAVGGSASVQNNVQQQLAHVKANDYVQGSVDRGDKSKNDPKSVLRQVPTRIAFNMYPINGGPALVHYVPYLCTPWPGPRQCALPSI